MTSKKSDVPEKQKYVSFFVPKENPHPGWSKTYLAVISIGDFFIPVNPQISESGTAISIDSMHLTMLVLADLVRRGAKPEGLAQLMEESVRCLSDGHTQKLDAQFDMTAAAQQNQN